ncbi:phage tail tape measure protein, partial [Clostridium sp. CF012]|nr:phage tail tape measure protein [Clostridium sp. CF012]
VTGLMSKIPGVKIGKIGNVGVEDKGTKVKAITKPKVYNVKNNFGLTIPKHAKGSSYTKAGFALINEEGGEIRKLSSGETIIPADKSKQLIEKSKGGHTFIFNFKGNVGSEEFFEEASEKTCSKILGLLGNM